MKGIYIYPFQHKLIRENPDREVVTRRVIKPQPQNMTLDESGVWLGWRDGHAFTCFPRYQGVVYIKEAYKLRVNNDYGLWEVSFKDGISNIANCVVDSDFAEANYKTGKWCSPLFMPAWAARSFCRITNVHPEILRLPLPPEELRLEGGRMAEDYLKIYNGLWVWRYSFILTTNPEGGGSYNA